MKPVVGAFNGKTTFSVSLIDNMPGLLDSGWFPLNGYHPVSIEIVGPSTGAKAQLWVSNSPSTPTHNGVQVQGDFIEDIVVALDVPVRWIKAKITQAGSFPSSVYLFGSS